MGLYLPFNVQPGNPRTCRRETSAAANYNWPQSWAELGDFIDSADLGPPPVPIRGASYLLFRVPNFVGQRLPDGITSFPLLCQKWLKMRLPGDVATLSEVLTKHAFPGENPLLTKLGKK